tara:strand:+ start:4866 stop:6983 length:2118 start_codon:yes stop_codon:yes gene_type:complete
MNKNEFIKNIKFWNWEDYRDCHSDLNNKSKHFLLKHALIHGIGENRKIIMNEKINKSIGHKLIEANFDLLLPKDFVWNEYINLHSDLKYMNEKQAKIHYIMNGNYEQRNYINTSNINNGITKIKWQEPNKTEKECHEKFFNSNSKNDAKVNYISIPWANVIEFCHKYNNNLKDMLSANNYNLNFINSKDKINITTFQSYHIWKWIDQLASLNINVIFCPHAEKEKSKDAFLKYRVLVLPILLYPVITPKTNIDEKINKAKELCKHDKVDDIIKNNNTYDYSFVGNTKYGNSKEGERCTNVRQKLVHYLNNSNLNVYCKTLDEWHFNNEIYGKLLGKLKTDEIKAKDNLINEVNYHNIMKNSKYVLCPIGIGPNSIRYSETLIYEKIPIIISDNMWLPREDIFNKCSIKIKENSVFDLTNLKNINENDILAARNYLEDLSKPIQEFISDESYILLTQLYFDKNKEKRDEIIYCIDKNIKHNLIKKIVIFFEIISENKNVENVTEKIYDMYPLLKNSKIELNIIYRSRIKEISMNEMLEYSNNFIGQKCILSNNDIYFDESLNKIKKTSLIKNNEVVCLTRTNVFEMIGGTGKIWQKHNASQDSWIYVSPIKVPTQKVYLGWIRSDNLLCGLLHELGYNLSNPTDYINAFHYQKKSKSINDVHKGFAHNPKKCRRVLFSNVHEISNTPILLSPRGAAFIMRSMKHQN